MLDDGSWIKGQSAQSCVEFNPSLSGEGAEEALGR